MIEIRNVSKIYSSKGGVETRALDDVSIIFGETGLVFLLGKSGSGKSTLLNISGGLDEPTSGEVIVKGKSSKDFSGSDFDSYRNTFVGFVFQEYNILDEFNVEDNIALALELQGKPKDKEKIRSLLEEVDLADYAKRKPNTLSGGQKQRIAIARALIKDPQIIMADEPTGALDSATGKQVFDTLKKLSETRLVIVVSHDREFAETYGDRIVELKDGKIISDVSKRTVPPKTVSENLSILDGDTMTIKKGAKLSEENINKIREFLDQSDGDIIITRGTKQLSAFRKANRISEDGSGETFSDTGAGDVETKQYSAEDSKFIRSRLPVTKAIKIGASGLKLKPLRLFFTIFLSFIAFTMFGLFSTLMTYDGRQVAANTFADNGEDFISVGKEYHYRYIQQDGTVQDEEWQSYSTRFTPAEVEQFAEKFGPDTFGVYGDSQVSISNFAKNPSGNYYFSYVSRFTDAKGGKHPLPLKSGQYPKALNEVAVSSYTLEVLQKYGLILLNANGDKVDANGAVTQQDVTAEINEGNVIGKFIKLDIGRYVPGGDSVKPFKITGVFDSGEVPENYQTLKEEQEGADVDWETTYRFRNWFESGLASVLMVSDKFYDEYMSGMSGGSSIYVDEFRYISGDTPLRIGDTEHTFTEIYSVKVFDSDAYFKPYFFGEQKTTLAANEIIANRWTVNVYMELNYNEFDKEKEYDQEQPEPISAWQWEQENPRPYSGDTDGAGNQKYPLYDDDPTYKQDLAAWQAEYDAIEQAHSQWEAEKQEYLDGIRNTRDKIGRLFDIAEGSSYYDDATQQWVYPTKAQQEEARLQVTDELKKLAVGGGLTVPVSIGERSPNDYKIVGWYSKGNVNAGDGIYISQNLYDELPFDNMGGFVSTQETNYVEPDDAMYSGIYVSYDKTASTFLKLYDMCGFENLDKETDVQYEITSDLYQKVDMANEYAELLSTIFLWVGVVFAVFAALLLFNFISMSISNKRKEIGILRAVGARGVDVFKIFFAESGIIVGICLILSIIGSVVLCSVINGILRNSIGFMVTLFVFGFLSLAMMVALAVVVALISTFLPVYFAARKKPVDSIRAL